MRKKVDTTSSRTESKQKSPLGKSEKMYHVLYDAAPVGIGIADLEGNLLEANASMQEMTGYTLEELRKVGVADTYVHKSDRKSLLETMKKKGKVCDREVLQKRKDGSLYSVLLNVDLIEVDGRKLLLTTARDITEKKRANDAMKAAIVNAEEERNRSNAIIAAIGDGIMIQDREYRILYQNQIQKDINGDHTGEYCYKVFEGKNAICEGCPVELSLKDGKIHRSEKCVISDNGTSYFEFTASPLRDSKGEIIAGIKVIRNITERKQAVDNLKQSEEKYRLLIDNIHDGVFIIQDAKMQFANKAFAAMTGYAVEEIIGMDFRELVAPEDLEMVANRYQRRQAGENVTPEYEFSMLHKDGITRVLVNMKVEIITYRGRVASMGTVMDITECKRAELALQASEKKYSTIVEQGNDGIVIVQDGRLKFANPIMTIITGFTLQEAIGKPFTDFISPQYRKLVIEKYEDRLSGKEFSSKYEIELISKNGKNIPAEINSSLIEYEGRPADMAIVRDITERKRMEEELREGERFLASIFESIQDGVGIIDKDMNIIGINPTSRKWYPHASSFIGRKCYEVYHGRSERCEVCPSWQTLNTGESAHEVIPKHGPGGKEVGWLEIYSFPLIDSKTGQMNGVIEYVRDITERKKVEESLKLFSEAVEEAVDGVQIVDLNGYITYSNRAVEEMYGISQEAFKGKHVNEMNADPDFAGKVILPAIKETGRWVGELMVKHKDGHDFPIWLTTSMVKDREGKPIAMVGIIRDITERRRIERALKESEERYRSLFENSPISLWEEDCSGVKKYVDSLRIKGVKDFRTYFESHPEEVERCATMVKVINVNNATVSLFRARSKEELVRDLSRIFTDHSYDTFREELIAIAEGMTTFEGEDFVKTFTGDVIQIYLKWSVAPGYEETFSRRHVSIIDITERKRIEESIKKYAIKLEESNRMKELFIDIMHHDLMNPIATASGFIELLKEDEIYRKGYIETIERNLEKAVDLIDCATKFSRIESLERIEFMDIDLKEVIDSVIENLRPMADKVGIKIENNITGSMPVKANKIIEEVFANLISNAIKYAPEGKRIVVNAEDREPFWNVKVIDFGEGLKNTDKTLIFDRFCRIEKKGVKGSGLGLAIAKKITELHRGGIGVEDNPEGGAVFIVEVPKSEYLNQIH